MIRKVSLALGLILLSSACAFSQSTTVSGQVTDAGSQAWNNGTYSFVFVPSVNNPVGPYSWSGGALNTTISGSLNATGGYSVSIPSNSAISPVNSSWNITFCPQASSPCFVVSKVTITGGTQTVNATPPVILINLQSVQPPALAYSTSEITGAVLGSQFYLLGTGIQVCSAVSGNTCTTWGSVGGASNPAPANRIDPTQAPYNVKADGYIFADGTSSNGSPNFSSTSQSCATGDTGKLMVVVNPTTGQYPYGTGLVTVTGCSGANWVLSTNAGTGFGPSQNWALGSDATASGTGGLIQAYQAAITASYPGPVKTLALPCGIMIVTAPPFQFPLTLANVWNYRPSISGCSGVDATIFVLHPNITSGVLANGGNFFYQYSPTTFITGGLFYNGNGGNASIQHVQITGLTGNIPGTSGKTYSIVNQFGIVDDVSVFGYSMTNGTTNIVQFTQGEAKASRLNIQSIGLGTSAAGTYTGVLLQGQGINGLRDSVFQSPGVRPAVSCAGGANCSINGLYCSLCGAGIFGSSGASVTVVGSSILLQTGTNAAALGDNNGASTWYVFGNPLIQNQFANTAPIQIQNAGTVMDMSGTNVVPLTAGWAVSGSGQLNDRAGNTFPSALTQFTGKYVPIGGGSVATNSASAATNFGANLGSTNIVATSPGTAAYDVKIGFRQVTAGVGCGAGSNTVTGVLSWTSGGVVQSTGSNGVPALGTLTISANGSVGNTGTTNAYVSQPVHADVNTAISFTTTSTLASAGCSTTPQYVVDFSNI